MTAAPRQLVLRGSLTYAAIQAAFVGKWPGLRVFLFVDDHPYWKEHAGELGPGDIALGPDRELALTGNLTPSAASDRIKKVTGLAAEIYGSREGGPWNATLDEESAASPAR